MRESMDPLLELWHWLDAVEAAPPADAVEVLATELGATLEADEASFLIADFSGDALIRFVRTGLAPASDPQPLERVSLAGSPYRRALLTQEVQVVPEGSGARIFAPVSERGEAMGVLELVLPVPPSEEVVRYVASAAHALAYVVIANRRHTDLFESGQRSTPFSLAAEIQRRLLPHSSACEAAQFSLAGWLEPASQVGGDTFDYSVERDALHLSMTDAMGHSVDAALLATLALASLRNSRRGGVGLADQAAQANQAVIEHAHGDQFVTGVLLRLDLWSGRAVAVNAGHPCPFLRRADGQLQRIDLEADLPLGVLPDRGYREQSVDLQPGDRLIVLTDGFQGRNAAEMDVAAVLTETAPLHPRQMVHTFGRMILDLTEGQLQDDAAILCVDWHSAGSQQRQAVAGASQHRASGATGLVDSRVFRASP